jgi:hypothetical protein
VRTIPLIEVLYFARASIEATLLVSSDVSLFLFPVTHNFTCFLPFICTEPLDADNVRGGSAIRLKLSR